MLLQPCNRINIDRIHMPRSAGLSTFNTCRSLLHLPSCQVFPQWTRQARRMSSIAHAHANTPLHLFSPSKVRSVP